MKQKNLNNPLSILHKEIVFRFKLAEKTLLEDIKTKFNQKSIRKAVCLNREDLYRLPSFRVFEEYIGIIKGIEMAAFNLNIPIIKYKFTHYLVVDDMKSFKADKILICKNESEGE